MAQPRTFRLQSRSAWAPIQYPVRVTCVTLGSGNVIEPLGIIICETAHGCAFHAGLF